MILSSSRSKRTYLLTILTIFLLSTSLLAQTPAKKPSFWRKLHPDSIVNGKINYLPLPSISYLPETGLRLGLTTDFFFNTQKDYDTISKTRNSFGYVQAVYTTKGQITAEGFWQIFTPNERYFTRGTAGYTDFSEYFWGIGNETLPEKSRAEASYGRVFLQGKLLRKVKGNFFAGLALNYSDTRKIKFNAPVPTAEISRLAESSRSSVLGIGPNILFDYRNNPFSPTEGWYLEAFSHFYKSAWGSSVNYNEFVLDARKYFPIGQKQMIGIQGFGHFTEGGQIPWRELPRLGNPTIMRGFISGRYRDNQLWATQAEYRIKLSRFFVAAAFASVGGVAPTIQDFRLDQTRLTYGGGLRVLVNKKKQVYFRADYAFNNNGTSAFYLRTFDAF